MAPSKKLPVVAVGREENNWSRENGNQRNHSSPVSLLPAHGDEPHLATTKIGAHIKSRKEDIGASPAMFKAANGISKIAKR